MLAKHNVRVHAEKVAADYPFAEGDIQWTAANALRMVPAAVGAGVAAGLLGIGGGMILGPLFVTLNFQPQAISANISACIPAYRSRRASRSRSTTRRRWARRRRVS